MHSQVSWLDEGTNVYWIVLEDIAKKLNDIQTKMPSIEQQKRKEDDLNKQQELLKTIDAKMNYLTQNDSRKRSDQSSEPLHRSVEDLSKQQQPILETMRDLPKKLDEIRQSQLSPDAIKELSSKFEPLTQSIKDMQNGFISTTCFL